ncbi:TPR-like protein [Mycena galericulata]|nr:TPR-like protein [Mycena galericulata]
MLDTLNQAVCAYDDAVRDGLTDASSLHDLGITLLHRFQQHGEVSDITWGVRVMQDTISLTPDGHPDKPGMLNNLGSYLMCRFQRLGDLDDLNKSVSIQEGAVQLTPDGHRDKPAVLQNLGSALHTRFKQLGSLDDLNKSVSIKEAAVHLTPDDHPAKPFRLNNLGNSLLTRFEKLDDLHDLNNSVSMKEVAVDLTPDGHPDKPMRLNNLGNSLMRRFERLGDLDDANKSVSMHEAAVLLTSEGHPDKPGRLNNLGNSLVRRFERLGDLDDLNKSVSIKEAAVHLTPDGHPDKPGRLHNLAISLLIRFEWIGDLDDLNKSVSMTEAAVDLTPEGHPDKPTWLHSFGNSLMRRFERLGDLDDANMSVSMKEAAVHLTSEGHADKARRLNDLGNSLDCRFERLGDLDDLNKSVSTKEAAVHLTPDGHPDKPGRLNNLGSSLVHRFERLGELDDLNRSVSVQEAALYLAPEGHPDKPAILNNLGSSLLTRFERLGDMDDLNKSAVHLTLDGHPDKPMWLNSLGSSLFDRFARLGDPDDLNKSVSILETVVHLIPDSHPDRPVMLNNLGNSLLTSSKLHSDHNTLQQAILCFTLAARSMTGSAHIRFTAASTWAKVAKMAEHSSLMDAYHIAIGLLPELAWLGLSIRDRHYHLLEAGTVARDAAAAAIASGQAELAVEWLEQGRSIIWSQLLNLRSPVDLLRKSHPKLANLLLSLSVQLEASGTREHHSEIIASGKQESLESIANQAHRSAHRTEELLKQIRELAGFSQFLLPKGIAELSRAAKQGPVVTINIGGGRCDALIVMPGLDNEVMHIPLTEFTPEDAGSLAQTFSHLVGRGTRLHGQQEGQLQPDDEFEKNLSKLWSGVVRPVLDGLAITVTNPQHIWWCPTGPLAFLPIHAAGLYGKDDASGSKLSDFAISSYTRSLTALIESFRAPSKSQKGLQILAVAQPSALGQAYIPGTQEEVARIEQLANGKLPVLRLNGDMATVDSVQQGMRDSAWVRFACHGVQDISHPTESALLLAGSSRLTLSSIIRQALPHADLAFLSACQTATGDKSLQEESVHLAAGMLLAGYRSVIATMWTIMDNDAPKVTGDVYEHLFRTSPPDPTRAAEALHLAIQKLRQESSGKKSFFHWVPFIHIGA